MVGPRIGKLVFKLRVKLEKVITKLEKKIKELENDSKSN